MLLTLAACSSGTGNASGTDDTTGSGAVSGAEDTSGTGTDSTSDSGTDTGADAEETAAISGVVNRLDDYLVLLTDDGEYMVFDFGEDVDSSSLEEGDRVTVSYTGQLGSEDPAPVAVSLALSYADQAESVWVPEELRGGRDVCVFSHRQEELGRASENHFSTGRRGLYG